MKSTVGKSIISAGALALVLGAAPGAARGQLLVDTGTPDQTGNASCFYVSPAIGQILAQKFTLTQDATVTKIETYMNGQGQDVTVHVANQVGATATAANVVTSFTVPVPHVVGVNAGSWVGKDVNLCLAAGNYWLVYSETNSSITLPTKVAIDIGTSSFAGQGNGDINIAFPPGSIFLPLAATTRFGVRITGTNGVVPGSWADRGFGLAGVNGIPKLVGSGTLIGGSAGSLTLTDGKPSALCVLLVSLASTPSPFKGGTLVPVPVSLTISLGTQPNGSMALPFTWPTGIPSATSMWFQCAISDLAAVQKVSLSNAVRATTP